MSRGFGVNGAASLRCRRSQGEDGRPGYNGVDEENFPSHGTYGTGAFNSMGKGSYDSRTQLYANRLSSWNGDTPPLTSDPHLWHPHGTLR